MAHRGHARAEADAAAGMSVPRTAGMQQPRLPRPRCVPAGWLPRLLLPCALLLCGLNPSSPASRPRAPEAAGPAAALWGAAPPRGRVGALRLRGGKGAVEAPAEKTTARKRRTRSAGHARRAAPDAPETPSSADDADTDGSSGGSVSAAGAAALLSAKGAGAAQQLAVAQEQPAVPLHLRRRPELQDVGSGWKTVKGKRSRVTGMDWDTWRRKRKVNASDFENSVVAPYEGSGPMLYQDVYGFSGKRVHRKVLRDSWNQMTEEEIRDKCERDAEAYLKAMRLNAELEEEYVGMPAAEPARGEDGDKHRWRKDLFPHVKAIMDNEAKGLHFTGRFATEEKDGRLVSVPTFANDTWRPNAVTGLPEPIPGAPAPNTLTIAEHERLHRYVREGETPAGGLAVPSADGLGVIGKKGGRALLDGAAGEAVQVLAKEAGRRNVSVAQFVDMLKQGKV